MTKLKFNELDISQEMKRAIEDMGFEEPSGIQGVAIPKAMEGVDMIGQAQTGTGKTVAFGVPAIENVDPSVKTTQVIILCPTRELAIQVSKELQRLCKYKRDVKILPVYGGQPIHRQISALNRGTQIVVGTPGRVMDHMRRGTLKLDSINTVILDEADEMLNMGFREDIETILVQVPTDRQTLLFSATMPREILQISNRYLKDPTIFRVKQKNITLSKVEQFYLKVNKNERTDVLTKLLEVHNPKRSIVFCNTKRDVDKLVKELQSKGYYADALHGDLKQSSRDLVMGKLRNGTIDILVATDIAARGIDVDDIEAVFNYELPQDSEYYIHRIGRTGRAGRKGQAFSFIYGRQMRELRDIERYIKAKIEPVKVPSLKDVTEAKADRMFDGVIKVMEEGNLEEFDKQIDSLENKGHDIYEIAAALLKMQMNLKKQAEIAKVRKSKTSGSGESQNADSSGMVRFFMNVGRSQNVNAGDVVGAVAGEMKIEGRDIQKVSVHDRFSFFEVPKEKANGMISTMGKKRIKGNRVNVEIANAK